MMVVKAKEYKLMFGFDIKKNKKSSMVAPLSTIKVCDVIRCKSHVEATIIL